jgi:hypothetical protein
MGKGSGRKGGRRGTGGKPGEGSRFMEKLGDRHLRNRIVRSGKWVDYLLRGRGDMVYINKNLISILADTGGCF